MYGPAIAQIAGGFTATQATGVWTDAIGKLIMEPVTVFDCDIAITDGTHGTRFPVAADGHSCRDWRDLARRIARELHQECVYLAIDGVVEFVKPDPPANHANHANHANKWL
jgi:hypothetical protein